MKYKKNFSLLFLVIITSLTTIANADLTIVVNGVPGSGETTWFFSGSYVITAPTTENEITVVPSSSSTSSTLLIPEINAFKHNLSQAPIPLVNEAFFNDSSVALGGSAIITGSRSGLHILNGLYIDADTGQGDDFGWFANGQFADGETLIFSGVGTLQRDITEFGDPNLTFPGDSFLFSSTSGITPLNITFNAITGSGNPVDTEIMRAHALVFDTIENKTYFLESTDSLDGIWTKTGMTLLGTGTKQKFFVEANKPREFYRVLELN